MKRSLAIFSLLLFGVFVYVGILEARKPVPIPLTPSLTGQVEYCLTCHTGLPEISPSHPVETFGCVRCHGGERLALEKDLAHSSMRGGANPADLRVVEASCGGADCHSGSPDNQRDHIQRVQTSVQSTYAGAIASIRYTFGAQDSLQAHFGIAAVTDAEITTDTGLPALQAFDPANESHPILQQFAANCLDCHLYAEARPALQYARFTGCAACHTPLEEETENGEIHTLTTSLDYTQCNTCHNRGNYDLRSMTFVERSDHPQGRIQDYYQPIAQFVRCEWTLDCVDCHTRQEAMGDGDLHSSQAEVRYIQCRTCHGTLDEPPRVRNLQDPDDPAFRMAFLNPVTSLKLGDTLLVTDRGETLWNTRRLPDGTYELFSKASGQRFTFQAVQGSACQQRPDEQASQYCHECHAVER